MIKVCLNGGRRPSEHPGVPVTPAELAVAARAAVAAGAGAVHLHPRDGHGLESLQADDVAGAVAAVRLACPGVPVGVTTGLWITGGDVGRRLAAVRAWTVRPDFASLNVKEPGFVELAGALRENGIGVEAGVWTVADADALVATGLGEFTRILVEIMKRDTSPDAVLRRLAGVDGSAGVDGPRLLHGEGELCWAMVAHAGRLGLDTRIGLEDTLTGPAGEVVADNAELVRLAVRCYDDAHRRRDGVR